MYKMGPEVVIARWRDNQEETFFGKCDTETGSVVARCAIIGSAWLRTHTSGFVIQEYSGLLLFLPRTGIFGGMLHIRLNETNHETFLFCQRRETVSARLKQPYEPFYLLFPKSKKKAILSHRASYPLLSPDTSDKTHV